MENQSLSKTLQDMARTHPSRSETDRLRDVYLDVEAALKSGVSRQAVLDALHQDGFKMSLKMFDKALYRIRKANRPKETGNKPVKSAEHPVGTRSEEHAVKQEATSPARKPMTPTDLQDLRKKNHDWVALSKPVRKK